MQSMPSSPTLNSAVLTSNPTTFFCDVARCCAPFRPFAHGGPVSLIVRRAFLRSGIKSPSLGSHILRHSVASEMLRQGTPLYGIATVLRHSSIETTTIYAKVDLKLLRQASQPWPEVLR